ncbi:MAG: hypothetical protein ACX939_05735, partial [Hyphococcus sp.]
AALQSLAQALQTVESDHDLGLALRAVLENETLSEASTPALLTAATSIESDHDLRLLIEAVAERGLDDASFEIAIGLYDRIESDYDLRVSAEALLDESALSPAQAAQVLSIAGKTIDSDHDMRLVLEQAAPMASEAIRDAWFEAFGALGSDHDRRLALETLAGYIDNDAALAAAYREAAARIESDRDRRLALEAIDESD